MAGPMTQRPGASRSLRLPSCSPDDVRRAVAEIAGAPGAWCPALSPGRRPGRLRHRPLGHPAAGGRRRSTAGPRWCCRVRPRRSSRSPGRPDGGRLAYLVSPGGSICAELHVVRPDGSGHRVIAGEDPRATVFAGGWTGPGPTSARSPPATARTPTSSWSTSPPASTARWPPAASCRSPRCPPTSASCWPAAARAATGTSSSIDVATGVQRRALALDAPGGIASEDGRFGAGRPLGLRARLAARSAVRPTGPGSSRPAVGGRRPGGGRVVLRRPDADLDGYALRTDGTVLAVWNADGVTELLVHALADGSVVRQIALPEPVMPGWSLSADGATMVAELTGPRSPRGAVDRPARRRRGAGALPSGPPRPDPALLVDAGPPRLRRPRRAAAVGLALRAARRRGPNRTVVSFHGGPEGQERPS